MNRAPGEAPAVGTITHAHETDQHHQHIEETKTHEIGTAGLSEIADVEERSLVAERLREVGLEWAGVESSGERGFRGRRVLSQWPTGVLKAS